MVEVVRLYSEVLGETLGEVVPKGNATNLPPFFRSNWRTSHTITTAWATQLTQSYSSGQEERIAQQSRPIRSAAVLLSGLDIAESTSLLMSLYVLGNNTHANMPIYCDFSKVTANSGAGTRLIWCDTTYRRFYRGQRVAVTRHDGQIRDAYTGVLAPVFFAFIESVFPDRLVCTDTLSRDITAGDVVYPMIDTHPNLETKTEPKSDEVVDAKLIYTELDGPSSLPGSWQGDIGASFQSYEGFPILSHLPNWASRIAVSVVRQGNRRKEGRGNITNIHGDRPLLDFTAEDLAFSRKEAWELLRLFDSRKGRTEPFWHLNPLTLWRDITIQTTFQIEIPDYDYSFNIGTFLKYIAIELRTGEILIRQVASVSALSGKFQLNLADGLPSTSLAIRRLSSCHFCRFGSDALIQTWAVDTISSSRLKVTELTKISEPVTIANHPIPDTLQLSRVAAISTDPPPPEDPPEPLEPGQGVGRAAGSSFVSGTLQAADPPAPPKYPLPERGAVPLDGELYGIVPTRAVPAYTDFIITGGAGSWFITRVDNPTLGITLQQWVEPSGSRAIARAGREAVTNWLARNASQPDLLTGNIFAKGNPVVIRLFGSDYNDDPSTHLSFNGNNLNSNLQNIYWQNWIVRDLVFIGLGEETTTIPSIEVKHMPGSGDGGPAYDGQIDNIIFKDLAIQRLPGEGPYAFHVLKQADDNENIVQGAIRFYETTFKDNASPTSDPGMVYAIFAEGRAGIDCRNCYFERSERESIVIFAPSGPTYLLQNTQATTGNGAGMVRIQGFDTDLYIDPGHGSAPGPMPSDPIVVMRNTFEANCTDSNIANIRGGADLELLGGVDSTVFIIGNNWLGDVTNIGGGAGDRKLLIAGGNPKAYRKINPLTGRFYHTLELALWSNNFGAVTGAPSVDLITIRGAHDVWWGNFDFNTAFDVIPDAQLGINSFLGYSDFTSLLTDVVAGMIEISGWVWIEDLIPDPSGYVGWNPGPVPPKMYHGIVDASLPDTWQETSFFDLTDLEVDNYDGILP